MRTRFTSQNLVSRLPHGWSIYIIPPSVFMSLLEITQVTQIATFYSQAHTCVLLRMVCTTTSSFNQANTLKHLTYFIVFERIESSLRENLIITFLIQSTICSSQFLIHGISDHICWVTTTTTYTGLIHNSVQHRVNQVSQHALFFRSTNPFDSDV